MTRTLFAAWLCIVALGVLAGWTARGATGQQDDSERQQMAEDRRRFGAELNACGEWLACRIEGEARYCDIVRQHLKSLPTAEQAAAPGATP